MPFACYSYHCSGGPFASTRVGRTDAKTLPLLKKQAEKKDKQITVAAKSSVVGKDAKLNLVVKALTTGGLEAIVQGNFSKSHLRQEWGAVED